MTDHETFAIFILTHGRPDKMKTVRTLQRSGYTGPVYIVIDNEDPTGDEYRRQFDNVIEFDKLAIANATQKVDNFPGQRGAVIFARNACFQIARDLNIKYFMEMDDDYSGFYYKFDEQNVYQSQRITNLDGVLDAMLDFYKATPATSVAMMQAGDFLGGRWGGYGKKIRIYRKSMNTMICSTDRPYQFLGRINEDVNTYVLLGSRGHLFFGLNQLSCIQSVTQLTEGGMTEFYRESGTYIKSFYTVIVHPSSVKIAMMRSRHARLHHQIRWRYTVPKIVPESLRKRSASNV